MTWAPPLLIGCLLLVSLGLSRTPLRSRSWQLLRVLLPSWRFFEELQLGPQLWVRTRAADATWGAWQVAISLPPRRPSSLLLDAAGNAALACQSVVEQLWSELDGLEVSEAPKLASYQLVQLIAARGARSSAISGGLYQFCLSESAADDDGSFVSEEHEL